jgi:hypothetical protein
MITKSQIIDDMHKIQIELQKLPSKKVYEKMGSYSLTPIKRLFGNYSNAFYESFHIRIKNTKPTITCAHCGHNTKNPKFCCRACSASYLNNSKNGRKIGKRKKQWLCKVCNEICEPRKKRCESCKTKIKTKINGKTIYVGIETLTKRQILTNDTQKYRRIRNHARVVAKKNGLLSKCLECDYDIHVECCHKHPIKKFPLDTLISEINHPSNLLGLCRNHHWEFDHIPKFHKEFLSKLETKKATST